MFKKIKAEKIWLFPNFNIFIKPEILDILVLKKSLIIFLKSMSIE